MKSPQFPKTLIAPITLLLTAMLVVPATALANDPPVAVIEADVTSGQPPLTVQFDGTGSYDPEGGPLTYNWDFGDGVHAVDPTATHTYSSFGSYLTRLRVIDNTHQGDIEGISITVGTVNQSRWR